MDPLKMVLRGLKNGFSQPQCDNDLKAPTVREYDEANMSVLKGM